MQLLNKSLLPISRNDHIKAGERLDFNAHEKRKSATLLYDLQYQLSELEKRAEKVNKSMKFAANRCY